MGPEGTKWERNLPPLVVSLYSLSKSVSLLMLFLLFRLMLLLTTTKFCYLKKEEIKDEIPHTHQIEICFL